MSSRIRSLPSSQYLSSVTVPSIHKHPQFQFLNNFGFFSPHNGLLPPSHFFHGLLPKCRPHSKVDLNSPTYQYSSDSTPVTGTESLVEHGSAYSMNPHRRQIPNVYPSSHDPSVRSPYDRKVTGSDSNSPRGTFCGALLPFTGSRNRHHRKVLEPT